MKSGAIGLCLIALISTLTTLSAQNGSGVCRIDNHLTALPGLWEASGVAVGSGTPPRLWIVNDEGEPVIYSVDLNGRIAERVSIAGATVEDWEDLAAGPCPSGRCLYIADIGDNLARRPRITVYRVSEPRAGSAEPIKAEAFHATYPDGPHNAESLIVDGQGRMFLITKGRSAVVYRFPASLAPGSTSTLEKVAEISLSPSSGRNHSHGHSQLATGAALSPDRNWVAIRSNRSLWFCRMADLIAGQPRDPIRVDLAPAHEPQGEGIAFGPGGTIYLVGEGAGKGRPGTLTTATCELPR